MEHFKIIETMYIANIFAIQNPYYLTFDFCEWVYFLPSWSIFIGWITYSNLIIIH